MSKLSSFTARYSQEQRPLIKQNMAVFAQQLAFDEALRSKDYETLRKLGNYVATGDNLKRAAQLQDLSFAAIIVASGQAIEEKDIIEAMNICIKNKDLALYDYLLEYYQLTDKGVRDLLHSLMIADNLDAYRMLVDAGSTVEDSKDEILVQSIKYKSYNIFKWIITYYDVAYVGGIIRALDWDSTMIIIVLDFFRNVMKAEAYNEILENAIRYNRADIVRILIKFVYSIKFPLKNRDDYKIAMVAYLSDRARSKDCEILRILLSLSYHLKAEDFSFIYDITQSMVDKNVPIAENVIEILNEEMSKTKITTIDDKKIIADDGTLLEEVKTVTYAPQTSSSLSNTYMAPSASTVVTDTYNAFTGEETIEEDTSFQTPPRSSTIVRDTYNALTGEETIEEDTVVQAPPRAQRKLFF